MALQLCFYNIYFKFLYVLCVMLLQITGYQSKDYCEWETFNPTCPDSEVIIIQKAVFGIMKIGTCIEKDYGFLGCSSDQLVYLDNLCSGKHTCEVDVGSKEIKSRLSCPNHYLDTNYICQKVVTLSQEKCYQPAELQVKHSESYLASLTSKELSCGLGNTPWILKAKLGQSINMTLVDFAWEDGLSVQNSRCERQYGHVLRYDNNDITDICGSVHRQSPIGLFDTNQVQVVFQDMAVQTFSFIIKYEAIGCPNIIPPKNAWLKKENNDVTIGCHSSPETWRLKCVGNHWIGVTGNCSQVTKKVVAVEEETFGGNHVMAVAVGCLTLIMCCVTITIGGYCIRRYRVKISSKYNQSAAPEMYLLPRQEAGQLPSDSRMTMVKRPGSSVHTLPHGIHMSDTNCNTTLARVAQPGNDDNSVLYYVLEQPPIYSNDNSNVINNSTGNC